MTDISGKWTYRSFHNDPAPVGDDAEKALRLIFAEAEFTFEISGTELSGMIDWGSGGLALKGTIQLATATTPLAVQIVGTGRTNLGTEGWEYDYNAQLAHQWPNGINQVPALVGSVIRAKPHGSAPAGYVASFIAVKQP
ncbi:hypothetical protein J6500_04585 [Bradyrhizobium sp. WSM 1704]|uniref:hypothetical protein n=1 Tax=Bradyrhizobium semiaridum TaxID=2821404 RepID=UPI001CE26FDF|nr:hypothetical protein [Bradyrhizobium semiaridum]MCA6121184.1 hypothetical protein [Bradyrhizobium semiaridum]